MSAWRAFCETVHLVVLGLWLGMLVGVAAAAAVVFPTMRDAGVRLSGVAGDGADHWRIVAGMVAEKVFLIGDAVMFPCALIATATMLCMVVFFGASQRRASTVVRAIALGIAMASLGAMLLVVTPAINAAAVRHRAAAKIGDAEASQAAMKTVDELHPMATNLMGAEAISVLLALACGAWGLTRSGESMRVASGAKKSTYEEPALLKGKRT